MESWWNWDRSWYTLNFGSSKGLRKCIQNLDDLNVANLTELVWQTWRNNKREQTKGRKLGKKDKCHGWLWKENLVLNHVWPSHTRTHHWLAGNRDGSRCRMATNFTPFVSGVLAGTQLSAPLISTPKAPHSLGFACMPKQLDTLDASQSPHQEL